MLARLPVALVVLIVALTSVVDAAPAWVEVKSPNFTVISDAGEKSARGIASQFEQVRAALTALWPWAKTDPDRPIVVYAVKDEASMRTLAPKYWEEKNSVHPASLFVTGPDRHLIAVRTDVQVNQRDINPYLNTYWSYIHILVEASFARPLPLWFSRGLSWVFSNTIVRTDDILIGSIIPWYVSRLREGEHLSFAQIVAVERGSPYMTNGARMELFDAGNWALVHYLIFGDQGRNGAKFNAFAAALKGGAVPDAALAAAYGDLGAVAQGFEGYVNQYAFVYKQAALDVDLARVKFPSRQLTASEAAVARAMFYAVTGRSKEAWAHLEIARKGDATATADEVEGMLYDAAQDWDGARQAYERVCASDSGGYYARYRYAVLAWPRGGDADANRPTLEKIAKCVSSAVNMNPRFAAAYALLAQTVATLGDTDRALGLARRAISLEPRVASHHLTVAQILMLQRKPDDARAEALTARALASTDDERAKAQELIDAIARATGKP